MFITDISIRRPVVSWVMSLILIIFGLFVFWKLPVRELPAGIQPPVVQVQVDYSSAAAPIVDQEVTQVIDDVFDCSTGHPPILKSYLGGNISLETMVIYDIIFEYGTNFDKKLNDPVWETVSRKIKKYKPFLNIDVPHYKKILKEIVIHGS